MFNSLLFDFVTSEFKINISNTYTLFLIDFLDIDFVKKRLCKNYKFFEFNIFLFDI